jgi:hypothetical protein
LFLFVGTIGHVRFLVYGNSIISFLFHLHLIISIHCYVLFDMFYLFTYRAQRPLSSDRSNFLRCCTARSRRLEAPEEDDGEEDDGVGQRGGQQQVNYMLVKF